MRRLSILTCALLCLCACQTASPVALPISTPTSVLASTATVVAVALPKTTPTTPPTLAPTTIWASTATNTAVPTATSTPSRVPSDTPTYTATLAPSNTSTITLTPTVTESPTATHTSTPEADAVVANATLNLRSGPGDIFDILGSYRQGTLLTVISKIASGAWLEVEAPDGKKGWMYATLLQVNIPSNSIPVNANPPTRAYNAPGIYDFEDICIRFYVNAAYGDECLWSVEVRTDGRMQFNFRWGAVHVKGTGYDFLIKYSDEGNRNMYITDDLGNRYDHVEIGGAAQGEHRMYEGQFVEGWFLFEPAKPGITAFTFHDDDQHKTFDGIVLLH